MAATQISAQGRRGIGKFFTSLIIGRPWIGATVTLLVAMMAGGCRGPIAYMTNLFTPPPKKQAMFEPDDVTTLIFVDDLTSGITDRSVRRNLSLELQKQFQENGVFGDIRGYEHVERIRQRNGERKFARWPIDEVGTACDAKQVLYVEISEYYVQQAGGAQLYSGKLRVQVKVVDVEAHRRLWPAGPAGHSVRVERNVTEGTTADFPQQMSRGMINQAADQLAKLFYKHQVH